MRSRGINELSQIKPCSYWTQETRCCGVLAEESTLGRKREIKAPHKPKAVTTQDDQRRKTGGSYKRYSKKYNICFKRLRPRAMFHKNFSNVGQEGWLLLRLHRISQEVITEMYTFTTKADVNLKMCKFSLSHTFF